MTNIRTPSAIDALANEYFHADLALSPEAATVVGTDDADHGALSDYSPAGVDEQRSLISGTLAKLNSLPIADDVDRITVAAMNERLGLELELIDSGERCGEINVIASPIQGVRDIFDLMPTETEADWDNVNRRLGVVAEALEGYKESLRQRIASGPPIPARQIERCAEQCEGAAGSASPFLHLVNKRPEVAANADSARVAYGQLADFLRETALPTAVEEDAVGRERYSLFSRHFLGADIDLDETYEWGKAELSEIVAEQERTARELYGPGVGVREAMERLDSDPKRRLSGVEALQRWMQETADASVAAMSEHFDIPEPLRTIECCLAPSGTGIIYYTPPTGDFSRPGRMWWSVPSGVTEFATWKEKTTVYHEGVPGHHLQIGLTTYMRDLLNDWRRNGTAGGCWVSGHGEGWALYAEQLMAELGYMDELGDRMGVLDSMRLRTSRVVVDLGVHLRKDAGPWGEGTWDADSAWRFLRENVASDDAFLRFELNRYLGWPGQAPSYKIGQRIWTQLREEARAKEGANFDLKAWHNRALSIGSVGLDVLREALA